MKNKRIHRLHRHKEHTDYKPYKEHTDYKSYKEYTDYKPYKEYTDYKPSEKTAARPALLTPTSAAVFFAGSPAGCFPSGVFDSQVEGSLCPTGKGSGLTRPRGI